mgnify:FL=1|jgi:hypothetical protein
MQVNFLLAEVIQNNISDTYKEDDKSNFGSVIVRTYDERKTQELICRPANPRHNDIPLIGEHVLIFQGTNQFSTVDKFRRQWYYFPAYNIQSNVNHNALPGIAEAQTSNVNAIGEQLPLGESFKEKEVSQLQPYEGDTIIQGRFSNSIRLGSTVNNGNYTLQPTWGGDTDGDPIIIISNAHKDLKDKKFTIESFKEDFSSLYLTSMQQLIDLKLYRNPTKSSPITSFKTSQFIADANRIILRAKTDSIILDSPNRITLGSPEIRIGAESAGHPLVKGDKLRMILNDLVAVISAGVIGPAGIASAPLQQGKLINILKDIGELNSNFHYFDK